MSSRVGRRRHAGRAGRCAAALVWLAGISPVWAQSAPAMDPGVVRVLISAEQETTLAAPMSGTITGLSLTLGSAFRRDETLFEFDCAENEARAKVAEAELRGARETFQAKSRLRDLQAAGPVEVSLARAEMDKSQGQLALIRAQIAYCRTEAPFDGRVARLHVRQYQGVTAGVPLADIISDGPPKVRLSVPSRWLARLQVGMPFEVAVDETGQRYPARITALGARVDVAAQTIEIEGHFDAAHPGLLAGMSGTAYFDGLQ